MKFYLTILIMFFELHFCDKNELNFKMQDNKKSNTEYRCEGL